MILNPPQNLEAERSVAAAVVMDKSARNELFTWLAPEDFWRESYATIYRVVRDMESGGQTVDGVTVWAEIERRQLATAVGGLEGFETLFNSVIPVPAQATHAAQIVKQKSILRETIAAANEVLSACYSGEQTAEQVLELAETRILGLTQPAGGEPQSIRVYAREVVDQLFRRAHGEVFGVGTGLDTLDDRLGRLMHRRLYVLAARPSMGKSALAMNIADAAAGQGVPTLFVSLEMGGVELAERVLSSRSGLPADLFRYPERMTDSDSVALEATQEGLAEHLHVLDAGALTLGQLGAHCRRHKSRHGLGLLVIDYLQLLHGPRLRGESREGEVARIAIRCRELAKELNVPVIALSQLNRKSEERTNKEPMLSDLRESGQIEQEAHAVMLLHRPDYYDPNDQPGIAWLAIAKNRGGPTGRISLVFQRHKSLFTVSPDTDRFGSY